MPTQTLSDLKPGDRVAIFNLSCHRLLRVTTVIEATKKHIAVKGGDATYNRDGSPRGRSRSDREEAGCLVMLTPEIEAEWANREAKRAAEKAARDEWLAQQKKLRSDPLASILLELDSALNIIDDQQRYDIAQRIGFEPLTKFIQAFRAAAKPGSAE